MTTKHRPSKKDPVVKDQKTLHAYRAYDEGGHEMRVDAHSQEEAEELAMAWAGWEGKVVVEMAKQ